MDLYVSEEEALASADEALYAAKRDGRNQYHLAE
jgi:PleD family two-component response regulator